MNKSEAGASLEPVVPPGPETPARRRASPEEAIHRGQGADGAGPLVRLGLVSVKGIGEDLATEIAAGQPYEDMEDLVRRSGIGRSALESLATSGALAGLGEGATAPIPPDAVGRRPPAHQA